MKIGIQQGLTLADYSQINKEFLYPKNKIRLSAKHLLVLGSFSKQPVKSACSPSGLRCPVLKTRHHEAERRDREEGREAAGKLAVLS